MRILSVAIGMIILLSAPFADSRLPVDMTVTKLAQQKDMESQGEKKLFSGENILSGKQAFLMSLVVPGTGEFYAKSYIKAAAFFGAEACFWTGFFVYMNRYAEKTDIYEKYADDHWSEYDWRDRWYDTLLAICHVETIGIEVLPEKKNQQYYEMIGKYDWFALGWDDIIERDDYEAIRQQTFTIARADSANPGQVHDRIEQELSKYPSPHRDYYMEIRQDANDQYTIAKYFVSAAILNHVLSAFDAAWTVKRHNDRLYEGFAGIQSIELRPSVAINNGEPMPQIQCILKW